jgi:hypothetical protein
VVGLAPITGWHWDAHGRRRDGTGIDGHQLKEYIYFFYWEGTWLLLQVS